MLPGQELRAVRDVVAARTPRAVRTRFRAAQLIGR